MTLTPAPALTDERVRMFYACAYAWRTEDSVEDGERDLSEMRARQGAEFDTWLAAHDAAVIARAKREEREASGAQAIYVVQEWVEADGIHDGWNTAYGYFTNSRADAEGTLEHLRKTHRDTEFRLVVATRSDWTEATDDETR